MLNDICVIWSAEGWAFCDVSFHGLTVVLLYWFFVRLWFFCVYFVNLRCADEYVIVLDNLCRLCVCVCVYEIMFWFNYSLLYSCFLLFHVGIVNKIILVILFCLVFWLANCSPQGPIVRRLVTHRTKGWYCTSPRNDTQYHYPVG